ncbi:MAG TPA: glucokinase [Gammaproteobacteria bacterium]|nr:glucokinase [Gammaproteobacteria bacterium]
MDLIADIGATNARCALLDASGRILAVEHFKNDDFSGVEEVLLAYLGRRRAADRPRRAALAIAAPILGDKVEFINRGWSFSQKELAKHFNLSRLLVINDFAAVAWALPRLTEAEATKVGGGTAVPRTPIAVLGPGSGLGVSSIVPSADGWAVAHGEGGHVTIAASTDEEASVIDLLRMEHGHCSAERVLSGPGLVNLYDTLGRLAGRPRAGAMTPADVTAGAQRGEPLALEAREMFFALLGTVAGNLALTVGALGGVYVAGGIVPKVLDAFLASRFRDRFEAKGRYRWYMERIPTYVITDPLPAFLGLRALLGYG